MTPEKALSLLEQTIAQMSGPFKLYEELKKALECLRELIEENEKK